MLNTEIKPFFSATLSRIRSSSFNIFSFAVSFLAERITNNFEFSQNQLRYIIQYTKVIVYSVVWIKVCQMFYKTWYRDGVYPLPFSWVHCADLASWLLRESLSPVPHHSSLLPLPVVPLTLHWCCLVGSLPSELSLDQVSSLLQLSINKVKLKIFQMTSWMLFTINWEMRTKINWSV